MSAKKQEPPYTAAKAKRHLISETKTLIHGILKHRQSFADASNAGLSPKTLKLLVSEALETTLAAKKYSSIRSSVGHLINELSQIEYNELQPVAVAFLGPLYSYSHLATTQYFGTNITPLPVATIPNVFEDVLKENANFGVVPIENSTDGRIVDTLNVLSRSPVSICGEINLPIHHTLLSLESLQGITEVYSKPQAISQCREWLAKHLPGAQLIDTPSTTVAAEIASETPGAAAIASTLAGTHYGLNAVASKIEDRQGNVTRFAILGNEQPEATGVDKTTLIVELAHAPGALADAMTAFKKHRLNLTWIESFPKPNHPSEYLFFIELEGHRDDQDVTSALTALKRKTQRISILGSFPKHA